ncbi:Thymidylate kinase [Desulfamplus magnetovallimortis]|uniref:Thymidylate kinase n=1 Tax=Desulfamplus magnetovallimortis TaxID=1246637 RepID=A0A1W1HL97_9BACT|nr:dTMP kinase [Desulfamplus magnetovallimortis]SLM33277.1 Thymidylate kinase [Desulfamplus magnetovallimortis]
MCIIGNGAKGFFVTLEGIEGSGKTTQMKNIADFLARNGHDVVMTREPGATEIGSKIRSILLDPANRGISPKCELLLYGADRAQHLADVVLPALDDGKTVLCDRFADATTAYQGWARGLDMAVVENIYLIAAGSLKPDLTILFDLAPELGLARTFMALKNGQRVDSESRFEKEKIDFHERVRQGYLAIAEKEKERFMVVDASLPADEVFNQITSQLKVRFSDNQHGGSPPQSKSRKSL